MWGKLFVFIYIILLLTEQNSPSKQKTVVKVALLYFFYSYVHWTFQAWKLETWVVCVFANRPNSSGRFGMIIFGWICEWFCGCIASVSVLLYLLIHRRFFGGNLGLLQKSITLITKNASRNFSKLVTIFWNGTLGIFGIFPKKR